MLEIQNISKRYGKKLALKECSLLIKPHEIVGILGQNGCGKSTLFKSIMGLIDYDSGSITYQLNSCDFDQRKNFGYMPEQRSMFLDLTLYDQLTFIGELKGLTTDYMDKRIHEMCEQFDLLDKKYVTLNKLSKGQQQKVQLMAALIHNPDVLILDEPLNGLDFYSVQSVMIELKKQASLGKCILISSHQMDFMDELCTHLLVLDQGITLKQGNLSDLYLEYGVCVSVNSDSLWQGISKHHKNIIEKGSYIEFHYTNLVDAKKSINLFNKENSITQIRLHNVSIGDMLRDNT
ncbi:MAG TPA: ATP-binding cassette domain-containing protein [Erysipelotrichaceae bacterium]|nr:ATP-binding cassette domain-containing protein [Erysipelotrichaceae bacterium]